MMFQLRKALLVFAGAEQVLRPLSINVLMLRSENTHT